MKNDRYYANKFAVLSVEISNLRSANAELRIACDEAMYALICACDKDHKDVIALCRNALAKAVLT